MAGACAIVSNLVSIINKVEEVNEIKGDFQKILARYLSGEAKSEEEEQKIKSEMKELACEARERHAEISHWRIEKQRDIDSGEFVEEEDYEELQEIKHGEKQAKELVDEISGYLDTEEVVFQGQVDVHHGVEVQDGSENQGFQDLSQGSEQDEEADDTQNVVNPGAKSKQKPQCPHCQKIFTRSAFISQSTVQFWFTKGVWLTSGKGETRN